MKKILITSVLTVTLLYAAAQTLADAKKMLQSIDYGGGGAIGKIVFSTIID